jgi:hypothetical protein
VTHTLLRARGPDEFLVQEQKALPKKARDPRVTFLPHKALCVGVPLELAQSWGS